MYERKHPPGIRYHVGALQTGKILLRRTYALSAGAVLPLDDGFQELTKLPAASQSNHHVWRALAATAQSFDGRFEECRRGSGSQQLPARKIDL